MEAGKLPLPYLSLFIFLDRNCSDQRSSVRVRPSVLQLPFCFCNGERFLGSHRELTISCFDFFPFSIVHPHISLFGFQESTAQDK